MAGLADGLYHYQPRDHSLELRAAGGEAGSPGLWLGFSSIHWREAWKYGERAFRYCQLDLGHLPAAVATAAALLGWKPRLVPMDSDAVAACLGLERTGDFAGVEGEDPEAILALHPADVGLPPPDWAEWHGRPGLLDPKPMYQWPVIEEAARATRGNLFPSPHGGGARGEGTGPALNHPVALSRPSGSKSVLAGSAFPLATCQVQNDNPGTSLIAAMAIFFKASAWAPSFYRHLVPDNFLLGQAPSKKPHLREKIASNYNNLLSSTN